MEPLPDLSALSDAELKDVIRRLVREENEVSYRRRILHGQIDILHAELQNRLKQGVEAGRSPLAEVDVRKLAEILASKGARPTEEELA